MKTLLNPYLAFNGNAKEAMEFYHSVFGGDLELHTFKESNTPHKPEDDELIMHSMIEADGGLTFMASDMTSDMDKVKNGTNISLSLSGDNKDELTAYFEKLAVGGTVAVPLEPAPWGDTFGLLTDKFGISWMVDIAPEGK